jgi:hypothetical protein
VVLDTEEGKMLHFCDLSLVWALKMVAASSTMTKVISLRSAAAFFTLPDQKLALFKNSI